MSMSLKTLLMIVIFGLTVVMESEARNHFAKDSTRIETAQKTTARIHTVVKGETVYSISRRYGLSPKALLAANKLENPNLALGQKLHIPVTVKKATRAQRPQPKTSPNDNIHIVKANETLYSLAKRYNVDVKDVKAWNKLSNSTLSLGQRLIVGKKDAATPVKTTAKAAPVQQTPKLKAKISVDNTNKDKVKVKIHRSVDENGKVTETGLATLIPDSGNSPKYLAQHRDAPIGTIVHIRNETNKLNVFVRVIGKLKGEQENEGLLIRISQKAYERLNAKSDNFPVKLEYILEEGTEQ